MGACRKVRNVDSYKHEEYKNSVKRKYLTGKKGLHIIHIMNYSVNDEKNNDNENLKRRIYFNLLYDFYSPLLTERQRKVYETLCFSDLTLSEAADVLGISRQAVYVLAHHVMQKLEGIERELCFAMTTRELEKKIKHLEHENALLREKLRIKEGEI